MKKKLNKFMAFVLTVAMLFTLMPAVSYAADQDYRITSKTLADVQSVLSGVAEVSENGGVITIKLTSDINGRLYINNNDGVFVLDLNGKTINPGAFDQGICADHQFTGSLTITGSGTLKKGTVDIMYVSPGHKDAVKIMPQSGYDYFTAKADGEDIFADEKNTVVKTYAQDITSNSYYTKNELVITQGIFVHEHSWSYAIKDENEHPETIVASCAGEGVCDATNKELTIIAPLHEEVNDGKNAAATLSAASVGGVDTLPEIWYRERDKYNYGQYIGEATTTPPEKGGSFEAYITVQGVEAVVFYIIEKLDRENIKQFTITDITSDTFVINLHEDDIGKTDFVCQVGGVYGIEFTPDANGRATIDVPMVYVGESNLLVAIKQKETDTHNESNQRVVDDLDLLSTYQEYAILQNNLAHVQGVLAGVADVTEEDGKIYIKLTSDINGRIRFDENGGNFILDMNGRTIDPGTTNEALCLDNSFDGTVTITGEGTLKTGVNNIIYHGDGTLKVAVAEGNDYFTLKKDGASPAGFAEQNFETKTWNAYMVDGHQLVLTQGTGNAPSPSPSTSPTPSNPPRRSGGGMTGPLLTGKNNKDDFESEELETDKPDEGADSGIGKKEIILIVDEKTATVFGKTVEMDVAPHIVNDRIMLPVRFVAENLEAEVQWDEENRIVTIIKDDKTIVLYIDKDVALVDGKEVKLDSPAYIKDDRTFVPVRFVAENFGEKVEWDNESRKVAIAVTK